MYKAEEELIQALKARKNLEASDIQGIRKRSESLVEASRLKLRLMGLSDIQIEDVAKEGVPDRGLIISDEKSPYVWVYADVYEYELSWVKAGQELKAVSVSFPDEEFKGKIEAIDTVLNPMTRSIRLRAKIENPELKLKPQMYVDIVIGSHLSSGDGAGEPVLAVLKEAVLDTGMRKVVYLDLGGGSYSGREVLVGPEASAEIDGVRQQFYPVVGGLKEGDLVVTKANFLIDSQSQLSGVTSAYGGALGSGKD